MEAGELDRLERLAALASPGPWAAHYHDDELDGVGNFGVRTPEQGTGGTVYREVAESHLMPMVAGTRTVHHGFTSEGELVHEESVSLLPHDAAFIAAARQAVPDLCAAVRALMSEREQTAPVPGEWTATPPTVPGWYWWRSGHLGPIPVRTNTLHNEFRARLGGEWWSVPIQPPGE